MAFGRTHRPAHDPRRCKPCQLCRLLCPDLAVTRDPESGSITIDLRYCKGCGICAAFCPKGALRMVSESESRDADADDAG